MTSNPKNCKNNRKFSKFIFGNKPKGKSQYFSSIKNSFFFFPKFFNMINDDCLNSEFQMNFFFEYSFNFIEHFCDLYHICD